MIYSRGNAAKQWIFEELDRRFGQAPVRILDVGCGPANLWPPFLQTHPNVSVLGIDSDAGAIEIGKRTHQGSSQIELRVFDAQTPLPEGLFDAVVALSTVEHVVDRGAFVRSIGGAMKSGGIAYLNYDAGHFRSHNIKERLMVPISQMLARFGKEASYMKKVDDTTFFAQVRAEGLLIQRVRKHNIACLKGFMKQAEDNAIQDWYEFEEKLQERFSLEQLDRLMLSTTVVVQKP
ncbi:MAG: class I SAM-dependent methyltransferase [bacterium]|nr:class I SAM-dependent methyltransferase [bacterium]